jgi:hypothetical protein
MPLSFSQRGNRKNRLNGAKTQRFPKIRFAADRPRQLVPLPGFE